MKELAQLKARIDKVFKPLTFNDKRHIYYWNGVKVFRSITKQVEEHVEKFDADKVVYGGKTLIQLSAAKQSKLRGVPVTEHELRHEWQTSCKTGQELGTETHDYMEYYDGLKIADTPQKVAGIKFHLITM